MPKDKCYHEAKEKYEIFPSAYASNYIAKCRKKSGKIIKGEEGKKLQRWNKEKWTDENGNECGSPTKVKKCRPTKRVDKNTPKTWNEMSSNEKKKAVNEKKKVGMGKSTSPLGSVPLKKNGDPKLYKPFRSKRAGKKYSVYVRSESGGVKLIHFGDINYEHYKDKIGLYSHLDHNDKERRKEYRIRHANDRIKDKNTPGWWSWHKLW